MPAQATFRLSLEGVWSSVGIVYLSLRHGTTYVRRGQEEYEARMREKQVKALRRKARQLGLEVVERPSGSVPTAPAVPVPG